MYVYILYISCGLQAYMYKLSHTHTDIIFAKSVKSSFVLSTHMLQQKNYMA